MTIFLYNNTNNKLFNKHIKNEKIYKTNKYIINGLFWGFKKDKNFKSNRKIFNNMNIEEKNYLLLINNNMNYLFRIIGKLSYLPDSEYNFDHCFLLQNIFLEINNEVLEKYNFTKNNIFINITKKYKINFKDITKSSILENKINNMDNINNKLKIENKDIKEKITNLYVLKDNYENEKSLLLKEKGILEEKYNNLLKKFNELEGTNQSLHNQFNFYKNYYDNYNVIVDDSTIDEDNEFNFVEI
jgi:hypothetical protein